jgi:hypothetical protein
MNERYQRILYIVNRLLVQSQGQENSKDSLHDTKS